MEQSRLPIMQKSPICRFPLSDVAAETRHLDRPVQMSSHRWHQADRSTTLSHMLAHERVCYHLSLPAAQLTATGY